MNMRVQQSKMLLAEPVPSCWYLLDVYPGRERDVMRWFGYYGLSGWYPAEISYVRRRGGELARKPHLGRRVVKPLVPGLIFVSDVDASGTKDQLMLSIPMVDGFHRIGDCWARMSPADMAPLRDIEAYLNTPRSLRRQRGKLRIGELVRVVDGPFSAFVGRLERLDSKGRLTVFLDAFKRGVSVQMNETQIEPITSTPRG
ncbi:transcription termination/antitermination protein NusG [Bradyrhizobium amphicarpaeae]|nr:transcription termination/antitermination NusG family protein [Bradyrhizobium amphicarpaeae]